MKPPYRRMLRLLAQRDTDSSSPQTGDLTGPIQAEKVWNVYIARCADDSLYTGIAKDVISRLAAHNAGQGAAYTRSRRPVKLIYQENGLTRTEALVRESRIKGLPRAAKLALAKILAPNT
jgi:predicted GIY-YIG superfamily endonuclease